MNLVKVELINKTEGITMNDKNDTKILTLDDAIFAAKMGISGGKFEHILEYCWNKFVNEIKDVCFAEALMHDMDEGVYIKNVIFNDPATIVIWSDGSKTVCKCAKGDDFNKETGLALCICKALMGNRDFHETFAKWCKYDANTAKEDEEVTC